jgi:hypothetical protein
MAYEKVKNIKAEEFKRLCGVKLETFEQMVLLVRKHDNLKTRSGRLPTQPESIQAGKRECIPHHLN